MDPKVLIEAAKRMKESPEVPSRLLRSQFKRSSWMKPELIRIPKKRSKQRLTKIQKELLKAFKEYDKACESCEVPSGGWCKNCEKYSCGKGGVNHS